MTKKFAPPPVDQREDGLELLAFHNGKWRHVRWSKSRRMWHRGFGGPFIFDGDRDFAPLPQKPNGAPGFYDCQD